jgi:hypothetical protein
VRVSATDTPEAQQEGQAQQSTAVATRPKREAIGLYNGVVSPDKWTLFGRMAMTVAGTEFVPKGLRDKPDAVMACLLYGDSLGLHPSVSLTDVYVADGKVGISGALMLAKIREAGHKVEFEWIKDDDGKITGSICKGQRIIRKKVGRQVVEEVEAADEWAYTLDDAWRAGLIHDALSQRAAWFKTPEVMLRWRSLAQLSRFLFPDVFRGQAIYTPDETEERAYSDRMMNGQVAQVSESGGEDDLGIEYGPDPMLAAWLVALFAACNFVEAGVWLPKKQKIELKGKSQEEREALALNLVAWLRERNVEPPSRPTQEPSDEHVEDGQVVSEDEERQHIPLD